MTTQKVAKTKMDRNSFTEASTAEIQDSSSSMETLIEQDPLIGVSVDGRYQLKHKLGSGGFGAVYLASDEKMVSRPVVVKILLDEKISHEWSVNKFRQETEALARIDHPSIVGIFDSGKLPDGKPFIVMQYVDGVSLRTLINVEGMDLARAANLIRQIGKALTAAHDRGILHRDLKPENIMVQQLADGDEQIKIIDFGVAKVKDSVVAMTTASDMTVGTAVYMSPEQLCARPLTTASDVYSFGIIAYEMLTGRRPMNPDSAYQLLELQRSGVRIKPTDLRPNLDPAAEAAILRALSFEPKDRYERARDFGDLVAAALIGDHDATQLANKMSADSVLVDAPKPMIAPPVSLQRTLAAVIAGVVLVGLIGIGAWYALRPKPKPATLSSTATNTPVGPEQSLTYWLTVQKMLNNKPLGQPIESEGNLIFGNGWKFRLNLKPTQSGALYLINQGPAAKGGDEYDVLFPVPTSRTASADEKLDARLAANQTVQLPVTDWYRFVEQTGVEKVWLIWSSEPLPELEAILTEAAHNKDNPGVIAKAEQIAQVQKFLRQYDSSQLSVQHDKSAKRTSVKGFGKVIVNLIELSHEAN